uniref:RRM domain-containing protein n=1 Tax=Xenopus tropicalis TaxID=8364 RepID=A0A6I8SJV2_XENTR
SHRDNCNVYIGNLGQHVNRAVLEQAFGVYGPLRWIWVAQKPPGFAFVEFEKPHDAAAAVQGLNGKTLCGRQIRVEFSIRQRRRKHINRRYTRHYRQVVKQRYPRRNRYEIIPYSFCKPTTFKGVMNKGRQSPCKINRRITF